MTGLQETAHIYKVDPHLITGQIHQDSDRSVSVFKIF